MKKRACGGSCRFLLVLSAALASSAEAQGGPASLSGTVRDTGGVPVPLARLSVLGALSTTDSVGRYVFARLPAGAAKLSVRRIGFEPRDFAIELAPGRADSLHVVLTLIAMELPGVTAEAQAMRDVRLSHFYRHRRGGNGIYFDRDELEARKVYRLSDLMRRLAGVRITSDRSGRSVLRMGRSGGGRDCPPDFWIDGVRAAFMNVDDIPMVDIEALEIYKGPSALPPELNSRLGNPSCGAVVIWTRIPGT